MARWVPTKARVARARLTTEVMASAAASTRVVGVRERALLGLAVAVAEQGLAVLEALADAVDPHRLDAGGELERVAVPDHHVRPSPGAQRADLAAEAERLGRPRTDRRE